MSGSRDNTLTVDLRAQRGSFKLCADFSVSTEGITAVCGKSGAGKSTLLRAIAGLEPARGLIRVGSCVWQDEHHSVPVHERRLGYVFQRATLFEHLNVRRNLEYGMRRRNVSRSSFEQTVQLLTLEKLLARPAHALSGGEQQRVAIGRALLSDPRLLLMDEPLSSLDAEHKLELLGYLEMLQTELQIPVLYVSHSPEEIARLADQLILLDKGNTSGCGSAAAMLTRLDLPLSLSKDAAALLTASCIDYESEFDLSRLSLGSELHGETLYAPGDLTAYGNRTLRLRVLARDVSLTVERQTDTSILNIVPVRVLETTADSHAQCHIRLDCGGQILLSKITQKSASQLQIRQGQLLYAQIKSVALL